MTRLRLLLALLVVLALACQPTSSAPTVGNQAPDFSLPTLDGSTVKLSDLRGKAVVINFWATWCTPCRFEMPEIVETANRYPDRLVVIAVDVQEDTGLVRPFVEEMRMTFPVALDASGEVVNRYRVKGLPTTFFVDREGKLRLINVGPMTGDFLDDQVKKLLG